MSEKEPLWRSIYKEHPLLATLRQMNGKDLPPRALPSATEMARFNAMRAKLLGGKPLEPGERMPVPHSGVGGDVPGNG